MKVAILTSSRADYGIYLPLLKQLQREHIPFDIIAFGTHLSWFHGFTLNNILQDGFEVPHRIESMVLGDTPESVASSKGLTIVKFSSFWKEHAESYDIVFCLGDRYEMFAAVAAGIPFNIRFAHLHAGEKTLGATDNIYRHAITHASKIHFASTESYARRLRAMLDEPDHIYNVGALSLDNLDEIERFSDAGFRDKWGIDLSLPTVLVTFHPETVSPEQNGVYALQLSAAIRKLERYQVVITMPNADTAGNVIRGVFQEQLGDCGFVVFVENFGIKGYFTIMQRCKFMLGNTSSGIIEAASFNTYVLNIGRRQEGRIASANVFHAEVTEEAILAKVEEVEQLSPYNGGNVYWNGGAAKEIVHVIKKLV